jgi:hypothetical protein
MIRVVHPGSRIRMLTFSHPGSRGQKGTQSRIPDPDPQHCHPSIRQSAIQSISRFLKQSALVHLSNQNRCRQDFAKSSELNCSRTHTQFTYLQDHNTEMCYITCNKMHLRVLRIRIGSLFNL